MEKIVGPQVIRGVLASDCPGVVLLPEGYASKDSGAATGFRLDGQFSVYQSESLAHADQA